MRCPRCGQENAPGGNFCSGCGGPLAMHCPKCGHPTDSRNRFCTSCGTSLQSGADARFGTPAAYTPEHLAGRIITSRAVLEGERKQVTILFADLKGSLELVATRDPEEVSHLLDGVLERMMAAVHEYEGTVNQVMGDGVMALFGAPLAHEDHALRACHAALRMLDLIERHAAEVRRSHDVDLRVRIGLNSGEVVVRSISSDLYMDYSAVGDSTHLAARMEQLARPGTALITARTLRLVEGHVEVSPMGSVPVKGLVEPVPVYELKGTTAGWAIEIAARRGLSRFVGRAAEMATLIEALDRAAGGRGQVVAIVGDPGVGKSRLIWELVHSSRLQSWRVLRAHALPYARGAPYRAVADLLGAYFGVRPDDDHDAIRERVSLALGPEESARFLAPTLAVLGVPADDGTWARLDADQQRRWTFEAVKHLVTRGPGAEPVCVVVEDLHWADPETLAVLDAVVERVAATRVLVIVSYRPEHRHEWGSKPYYRQVPVDTLAKAETEALLEELLGPDASTAPLKRMLEERTGGNPFFLEESVRNLVESGAVAGEIGARRLVAMPEVAHVPATVQSVLAARIDRLPFRDKRLLQTAAVIGKDVPRALLQAVADLGPVEVMDGLDRLQAGGFLNEIRLFPEVVYTFRHALTHEVTYGGLVRDRRRALDARLVEVLEGRRRDGATDVLDRLAHHAVRGERWEKAVAYCREAGQQALSRFAHRGASRYFEQALEALAHVPADRGASELAVDIRLEVRCALQPLGHSRRILEILTEARDLAERLGDRRRLGLIACVLCNHLTLRFEFAQAIRHGTEALDAAAALGDSALMAATSAMLALSHYGSGEYGRAVEAGLRATSVEPEAAAETFGLVLPPAVSGPSTASWALAELGAFEEARDVAARALQTAEVLGHPHSIIFACLGVGTVHLRRGAAAEAIAVLERALALAETADLPTRLLEVAGPLASAYVEAGRADDAIALLERAVARALELRSRLGHVLRSGGMAEAYLAAGRVEEALPLARLYVDLTGMVHSPGYRAWALRLLGDVAAGLDPADVATADAALGESLQLARALGMQPLEARGMLTRGRLLQRVGRDDEARNVIAAARERFAALDMPAWVAACRGA